MSTRATELGEERFERNQDSAHEERLITNLSLTNS